MANIALIDTFVNNVVAYKNKRITDEVFLLIQNNREFMREYLRLVQNEGLDEVNKRIGKQIKEAYKLTDAPTRNNDPQSTLILDSFQEYL
jgi:hypothetical protein